MAEQLTSGIASDIVGHKEIIERLFVAQKQGRLPSTFLFTGPDGVGRKKLALALIQSLVCEQEIKSLGACGQCGPCARLNKLQSEALLLISPEKNSIKIEQAHRILEFLSLRSISKARGVVVDSAHLMNPTAANTLLKILEEPPEDCYFFLIAPSPQSLLPTLRSRSQVVQFSNLTFAEMRTRSNAAEWALRASQGSFSRLAAFQNPEELEIRDSAMRFLELWMTDKKSFLSPEWREMVKDRASSVALSRYIGLLIRDAVFVNIEPGNENLKNSTAAQIINADKMEFVRRLSSLDLSELQKLSQSCLKLESGLQSNRDTQLAYEEFWLS